MEDNVLDYPLQPKCEQQNQRDVKASISSNGHSNNFGKISQNIFELIFEITGIKDQHSTKELKSNIHLAMMILLFFLCGSAFFIIWFNDYYNNMMLSNLILANNTETSKHWISPDSKYDTHLKVHIFNYTNIKQYLEGLDDKIKVEDIGPLTYQEHTEKVDVSFNKNYTVTFRDHRTYKFLPEKSSCRETDMFILPNVPLLTAAIKVDSMQRWKKFWVENLINRFREDAFKSLTGHNYLWGYRDNIVSLESLGAGRTHFGLLMNRNGTSIDSLQINTGEDDIQKFSIITQFNRLPLLDYWSNDECNRIDGSDPSMFPPHLLKNRSNLNVFLQAFCRKVPLMFEKDVTLFNNIKALRYRTATNVFGRPDQNPNNKCYCHNTKTCLPNGLINATKCYNGAPIFPSFPHFFSGDPDIYENFEGVKPNKNLHQTYADMHPRFAFPISGASRIQINIAVHKSSLIKGKVNRFQEGTVLPLIWIEITSGDFTDDIVDKLYISTFGFNAVEYTLKGGTLLLCIVFASIIISRINYKNTESKQCEKSKIKTNLEGESLNMSNINH